MTADFIASWPNAVYLDSDTETRLNNNNIADPHSFLGLHRHENAYIVRVFNPAAKDISISYEKTTLKLQRCSHTHGLFVYYSESEIPKNYRIHCKYENTDFSHIDPYTFSPSLGDVDLHLFTEGKHQKLFDVLGAHQLSHQGVQGVRFAVWAPNASRLSVIGNFNSWDGRRHIMRSLGSSGIWEIFIPELPLGEFYKFEIRDQNGHVATKSDPYANFTEKRPSTANVVYELSHTWNDDEWIEKRKKTNCQSSPLSIYEIHLGSWGHPELGSINDFSNYRDLAHVLVPYLKKMNFTHLELMPITEHPLDESWGYQVTGYFSVSSRFGTPDDFAYFVDYCHQNDIGVLMDWVPAHFPKDQFSLGRFDGTALYEHEDPRLGEHQDWGTYIFNFGRNEVRNFLIASALYWLEKFHIDGLRVDAVSSMLYRDYSREHDQWVPNIHGGNENLEAIDFIKELNTLSHELFPGTMMIAEESTAYANVSKPIFDNGLGYTMKWNMGWMHDFLEYFSTDAIHRQHHQNDLTFSLVYAFNEHFILPLSHDEVVHGKGSLINKMPGDHWQKFANLRALYSMMFAHPGRKLLFMGCELAQWSEWNCNTSLDWASLQDSKHKGIQTIVSDLNTIYRDNKALWELDSHGQSFEWIDFNDHSQSVLSFIRWDAKREEAIVVVSNLTPVPRPNYKVGVPVSGQWEEIHNSDDIKYDGSGVSNGTVTSTNESLQNQKAAIELTLPPLGVVYLKLKK